MSVKKRPDGKFRARFRGPDGREVARHFGTEREAKAWEAEQRVAANRGQWIDPSAGRVTFGEYAEAWVGLQGGRPSSVRARRQRVDRAVATFGAVPLVKVLPSHVQAWVVDLERRGLAPATVRATAAVLRQVFASAVRDRLVASSPAADVRLPQLASGGPLRLLTSEQVDALAAAVPEHLGALVRFSADTGLRQGEAFALTVDRVDFLRRMATVDRQLVDGRHRPVKTPASVRSVPLASATVELLAAHLAARPDFGTGLIFTSATGRPLQGPYVNPPWRHACAEVGVPWARWHDLRHHAASVLIDAGCSVKVVQRVLGHASAKVTLDTYAHLFDQADDRVRAAVDAARFRPIADSARTVAP
jgi:integrase